MSKVNVRLTVSGIPLNFNVDSEDERYVRDAAVTLNDAIRERSDNQKEKERGFFLAVAALQQTARAIKLEEKIKELYSVSRDLDKILEE